MKALLAAAIVLAGCSSPVPAASTSSPPPATSARRHAASAAPQAEQQPGPLPTLLITDSAVLTQLEREGLSLSRLLGEQDNLDNLELSRSAKLSPLLREVERDLAAAAASDPAAGVDVARFSHRLFDRRFLRLPSARLRLAGVVNRPDRAPFHEASCGETRLVYRLAYALEGERASKLPMTLAVELAVPRPDGGCRVAAARWLELNGADAAGRARFLRSGGGPLAPALMAVTSRSARVVVNVQQVRWPSTVRPDLGGHAEYLLRSFRLDASGALSPEALENTIDPSSFRGAGQRAELLGWLEQHADAVDAGTAQLAQKFLTRRALSVTPRGLNRLANRPFSATFTGGDLATRDFSKAQRVKSGAALLRRLDQLSCQGCHEARSVAGFHLLGEDAPDAAAENALASPVSAQVHEDLPRRLRIAQRMLAGTEPDFSAPFAERAATEGAYGSHCSLGVDPTFASWTCAPGLHCSDVEATPGDAVGQCLPITPEVGDACESGAVAANPDRRSDRMRRIRLQSCGDMTCNRSGVGFPGGMCTAECGDAGSACGAIAVLEPFNACLARGEGFLTCIRGNTRPAGLRACSSEEPCRDDYVCARGRSGGVCLPPYFVFQLRVDGHSSSLP